MASQAGTDQRTAARVVVALDVSLERRVGRAVPARTVDISTGGARVTSERPLRIDEQLRFDVTLRSDERHVAGTARVLRQDRHNVYALRFESIPPEAIADLRTFVDDAGAPLH